jgi:DNA-binding response OmpR family regulator
MTDHIALPPARIIVVEDEPVTRRSLAEALAADGHLVRTAADAFAGRAALQTESADLIVLDLGLPGLDGRAFADELRAHEDLAIVVVTSQADTDSVITLLNGGADDYLVKPVHLGELCARVRSALRRRRGMFAPRYEVGRWRIDCGARTVSDASGRDVSMTRGEFDLFVRLVQAGGLIVSRDLLSRSISRGGDEFADLRSVDSLVSRLRRKLASQGPQTLIVTAPGFGYRIGEPIRRL